MQKCVVAVLAVSQLIACATATSRPQAHIEVNSNPAGADAVIECAGGVRATGVTPTRVAIPRNVEGCVLTVSKAGMSPQQMGLQRDLSGKFWGPLAAGVAATALLGYLAVNDEGDGGLAAVTLGPVAILGLTSAFVDTATGRRWGYEPDSIEVTLQPAQ